MRETEISQFKEEIREQIEQAIEKHVNGGIRGIDKKLSDYIGEDTRWKEDAKPAIDNMKNLTNTGKLIVQVAIGLTAIVGAIIAIKKLLNL